MANKQGSPVLQLELTDELYERARRSHSGGCLIADAIKTQYPQFTTPTVDMATIRFSDRKSGVRYTYLTPPMAQQVLLWFDQGWPNPIDKLTIKRAVKIDPIIRPPADIEATAINRAEKIAHYEERIADGEELTPGERGAFKRMKNASARTIAERPSARGAAKVTSSGTVRGGNPIVQGTPHPNLLRGLNRHFGAKLADPGIAFNEAVEAAVAQRLTEQSG